VLYFAYGMNTNGRHMRLDAVRLGPALLLNYSWEMLQFANVYPTEGQDSLGILWDINDETLGELDIREGYPTFYDRCMADVIHRGEPVQAWVYFMNDRYRVDLRNCKPSEYYVESVREGFAEDGIAPTELN
jgi:hypothetical protein